MPSPLHHVRPSEPIRASRQNELIDRVNSAAQFSAGGSLAAALGAAGTRTAMRDPRRVAVWQLTGPMDRPETDGVIDDVPSAPAVAVWYFDVDGYPPENEYHGTAEHTRTARVYHVVGFPGDQRAKIVPLGPDAPGYVATPRFNAGDWVYAEFNPQSGRWEILSAPEDIWRFELKTPLLRNGDPAVPSTATAYLVVFDAQSGKYVRTDVEFAVADFLDVCDGLPGDRGYAKRLADSHLAAGWEVLVLGLEDSSSSGETSSGESSSGESSSGEWIGGLTADVDVVVCDPYRVGDYLYFPQKRLRFAEGLLVAITDLDDTRVYACCPDASSGEDPSSSGESSSAPCPGLCGWVWVPGHWEPTGNQCAEGCTCDEPDFEGSVEGETTATFCYGSSSSDECSGLCGWVWRAAHWELTDNQCAEGCTCDEPDFSGTSSGEGTTTFCY